MDVVGPVAVMDKPEPYLLCGAGCGVRFSLFETTIAHVPQHMEQKLLLLLLLLLCVVKKCTSFKVKIQYISDSSELPDANKNTSFSPINFHI